MNESDVICYYLENLICLTVFEKWNINCKHMFDGYQSDKRLFRYESSIIVISRMNSNQELNVNVAKPEISNADLNECNQLELKLISTLESSTYDANE